MLLEEWHGHNLATLDRTNLQMARPCITYLEDFFHLPRVSTTCCEHLSEFSKKFYAALIGNSGAWGKLIHEKN
jgi:hypothetical protein